MLIRWYILFAVAFSLAACSKPSQFRQIPSNHSGITFSNTLDETDEFNVFDFEYVYNGGGVAIGDINNDGLEDIYFTGNTTSSRLYINRGGFKFEDVTEKAGVATQAWATGVTMADVNADGWLDIYVCKSGHSDSLLRKNLLFINNRNETFTEQAIEFGLASTRYSTQAAFFDADRDGDLDMYLLNHSNRDRDATALIPPVTDGRAYSTDQFFENQGNAYKDVSAKAGITLEGYGLGVVVSDFNKDGWDDIYIANDYVFNDLLYINMCDGTFTNRAKPLLKHTSHFSMGVDAGDIDNDGWIDIMVADMMPPGNERQKRLSGPVSYNRYQMALKAGYQPSFMRNTLQLNQLGREFSEIGILTGMHETDWSWAVLMADFNNDSFKDIYITNGYLKNITDRDFSAYSYSNRKGRLEDGKQRENLRAAIAELPGAQISNYAFSNNGQLNFTDVSTAWFGSWPSFSNGAAYADLDNDGDLDLVVNNLNSEAFLFENNLPPVNYLQIVLKGSKFNPLGEGAVVEIWRENVFWQRIEKRTSRGYQSAVSQILNVGLSASSLVDIKVFWPDGNQQFLKQVSSNQRLTIDYQQASSPTDKPINWAAPLFSDITDSVGLAYVYHENEHDDFSFEPLLLFRQSATGPCMAVADIDGNNTQDIFIGGASGKPAVLFKQTPNGKFKKSVFQPQDAVFEDAAAIFFDANNDSYPDLYVVSGGNEFIGQMPYYQDRLYLNDGNGNFKRHELPTETASGSCLAASDFDKDGDIDLFVGGGAYPQRYPLPDKSFLFENSSGTLKKTNQQAGKEIERIGIVRDAAWIDLNNDSWPELVLVGDFMPLTVFANKTGQLQNITKQTGINSLLGFWQTIEPIDFDNDGDMDIALGNFGLNTVIKGSINEPFGCRAIDIDNNGSLDAVYSRYIDHEEWPMASRDQLLEQVPALRRKFVNYETYAKANPTGIFGTKFNKAYSLTLTESHSGMAVNDGTGRFEFVAFPHKAQVTSINDFITLDIDHDGYLDLLAGGNKLEMEATYGPIDAASLLLLKNERGGSFSASIIPMPALKAVKNILNLRIAGFCDAIVFNSNSDSLKVVKSDF